MMKEATVVFPESEGLFGFALSPKDYGGVFEGAEKTFLLGYTNNVIRLKSAAGVYYFKEAKPHLLLEATLERSFETFFDEVSSCPSLKAKLSALFGKKEGREPFLKLGDKLKGGCNFHAYLLSSDSKVFGLLDLSEEESEAFRRFLFYFYGDYINHHRNKTKKVGELEDFGLRLSLSESILAEGLGFGYAFPKCEFVRLSLFGKERFGLLVEEAKGVSITSIPPKERLKRASPLLLKDMNALSLFDAISGDNDHNPNNYRVVEDANGLFASLSVFDNDCPRAFPKSTSIGEGNALLDGLIKEDGSLDIVGLDEGFFERLLKIERADLSSLEDLLDEERVVSLFSRISTLKEALRASASKNPSFARKKGAWTIADLRRDLLESGRKTYLKSFVDDCFFEDGAHPFDLC